MVARIDRNEKLALLGFADPAAQPFIAEIPEADRKRSWQLILTDGRRLMEGEASVELLATIERLSWLDRMVRALHLTRFVGAIYRAISAVRGRLGWLFKDMPGPRRLP